MATLAQKLPYTHPFAGGYPYRGSQRLPSDPDALTYLAAVAAADGAPVETAVAMAVDDFFTGCKADGIWDAIKASCILCGARTLAGALVPLVGDAPTNVADGFVEGDYSRTAGLTGDGTSYLDSGRNNNTDPQNNFHMAVYETQGTKDGKPLMGCGIITNEAGVSNFGRYSSSGWFTRCRHGASFLNQTDPGGAAGLAGVSRSSAPTVIARSFGVSTTATQASQTPFSDSLTIFGLAGTSSFTTSTLAFYSIGEAIDLEALDARATALVTAIGAAV